MAQNRGNVLFILWFTFLVQLGVGVESVVFDVGVRPVLRCRGTQAFEVRLQVGEVHRRLTTVARAVFYRRPDRTSWFCHGCLAGVCGANAINFTDEGTSATTAVGESYGRKYETQDANFLNFKRT